MRRKSLRPDGTGDIQSAVDADPVAPVLLKEIVVATNETVLQYAAGAVLTKVETLSDSGGITRTHYVIQSGHGGRPRITTDLALAESAFEVAAGGLRDAQEQSSG
ncbi:hypothetical protein [Brevundimonas sp.]|uniref:hypothetical protein n=1 Tax=Brevundimonas sp. TaxID=1871086 RepID=UPI00286C3A2E|nr:hypothetical protein [Brevundimonas sp.]